MNKEKRKKLGQFLLNLLSALVAALTASSCVNAYSAML